MQIILFLSESMVVFLTLYSLSNKAWLSKLVEYRCHTAPLLRHDELITIQKMGSCVSSPSDINSSSTVTNVHSNGSDEAALIYSGHVNMSSKVTVGYESGCDGVAVIWMLWPSQNGFDKQERSFPCFVWACSGESMEGGWTNGSDCQQSGVFLSVCCNT